MAKKGSGGPLEKHANKVLLTSATIFLGVLIAVGIAFLGKRPAAVPPTKNLAKVAKDKAFLTENDPAVKVTDLPPRVHRVIDIHEHVQTDRDAKMLLEAMDKYRIERTCLMASTTYTFTLNNKYGFEGHHENNEKLLELKEKHPGRFCAFVTLAPDEPDLLKKVQDYVARGADGLKLYAGHGARHGKGPFHVMPLDDERLAPLWAWAEQTQLPLMVHINLKSYFDETVRVLERHPYLRMCIPHFGLHKSTAERLGRLSWILKRYPNVYTDTSFGWHEFHIEGFRQFARWRTRSNKYFTEHADKIMYASDMVIEQTKDEKYVDDTLRSYFQLLEMKKLRLFLVPELTMHGLALGEGALKKIYWEAPSRFLMLDDKGQLPDRTKSWPPEGAPLQGLPPTVPAVEPLPPDQLMKGERSSR